MTYLNFLQGQKIFDVGDDDAKSIAKCVHHIILFDKEREAAGLASSLPFDIAYFYDTLTRAFARHLKRPISSALVVPQRITEYRMPHLTKPMWSDSEFVRCGLAEQFISCVKADSTKDGIPFDMEFACGVACLGFTKPKLEQISEGDVYRTISPTSDEWWDLFVDPKFWETTKKPDANENRKT